MSAHTPVDPGNKNGYISEEEEAQETLESKGSEVTS